MEKEAAEQVLHDSVRFQARNGIFLPGKREACHFDNSNEFFYNHTAIQKNYIPMIGRADS
jgi:hypothetical protein